MKTPDYDHEELATFRKSLYPTQEKFAEASGIPQITIARQECGSGSIKALKRIARALGADYRRFLLPDNTPSPEKSPDSFFEMSVSNT